MKFIIVLPFHLVSYEFLILTLFEPGAMNGGIFLLKQSLVRNIYVLALLIRFAVMAICYPCLKYYVDIVQLLSKSYFSTTSNTLFYPRPLKHCDRFPFPESLNGPQPADAQAGPPGFRSTISFQLQ